MVEEGDSEELVHDQFYVGQCKNETGRSNIASSEENKGERKKGSKETELLEWLRKYPGSPINNIFKSEQYYNSKYVFWNFKKFKNLQILKIFNKEFINKSTMEMGEFAKAHNPIYNSPNGISFDYYYDMDESIFWMKKILYYQFKSVDAIRAFLVKLVLILDRRNGKCNTVFVQSPPNGGKNLFFDAVVHYYFSFGQIGNFTRFQNFPLMECVEKRILLWNEPQCESGSFETLKMLLGGDTLNVKVKYESDTILSKTPIVVLANYDPFPKDVAYRTRIHKVYWDTMDDLINCKLKLYPLSFYDVLKYFNVFDVVAENYLNEFVNNVFDDINDNTIMPMDVECENNVSYEELDFNW